MAIMHRIGSLFHERAIYGPNLFVYPVVTDEREVLQSSGDKPTRDHVNVCLYRFLPTAGIGHDKRGMSYPYGVGTDGVIRYHHGDAEAPSGGPSYRFNTLHGRVQAPKPSVWC